MANKPDGLVRHRMANVQPLTFFLVPKTLDPIRQKNIYIQKENLRIKLINNLKMKKIMKTKIHLLQWLMLLLLSANSIGLMAQPTGPQSVCPGDQPYWVVPGNTGDTFVWQITPGVSGVDWTITLNGNPYTIIVNWANVPAPVTYTLTLTETAPGPNGCSTTQSVDVTVNPSPIANAGPDQTICAGSTVTLAGSVSGSATSGIWTTSGTGTFDDPTSMTAIYTPSAADILAGTVTLTLTTNDPDGAGLCLPATDQMVITINPAAIADAGPDQTICSGSSATLAGSISGSATSAVWTTSGTGTFDDPTSLTAVYTPSAEDILAGTVTLTLTTDDPDADGPCLQGTDQMVITISPVPTTSPIYHN
jgi:hypothetical protein